MLLQAQMHRSGVVRFVICLCLVGFTAAKCDPEKCGSMNVSYPFWIHNPDCGYPGFQINCTKENSTGILAPRLPACFESYNTPYAIDSYYEIMKINYSGYIVINSTSLKASSCPTALMIFQLPPYGPFTISMSNKFVVIGNNTVGTYNYENWGDAICRTNSYPQSDPPYCLYGCCEITLPNNWNWIIIKSRRVTSRGLSYFGRCGFSTIFDPSTFAIVDNKTSLFWGEGRKAYYGLRLNWGIGLQNCSMAKATANYSCSSNAECIDSPSGQGHVCTCLPGYQGNGYLNGTACTDIDECKNETLNNCVGADRGGICHNFAGSYSCSCAKGYRGDGFRNGTDCTDIDECNDKTLNKCVREEEGGICHNFGGSYNCSCAKGYKGDGFLNRTRCVPKSINSFKAAIIGSVSSFVGVSVVACGLFWWLRMRRLKHERENNFRQNGGEKLLKGIEDRGGRKSLRIFSGRELEIASKNYSTKLGEGGFATVYKGDLVDGIPVAIKKPKTISDESDEFINEIIILSHINHRNVVKLLGCCMETQFPLLVYEYVPNGTVYEHLHSAEKHLPWETRRQIAIETAEAIAYMHFQASQPIFHRDIKSSNILLDNTFTPKVADLGISRLRPSDESSVSTAAVGTRGYMDPEFLSSKIFTDKSDVFSFGVVLVELLTGLKPWVEGPTCALYEYFLSAINDNRLAKILDQKVMKEENQEQMESMVRLAKACLQVKGEARPSMREVVEELVWIRAATKHHGLLDREMSLVEHAGDLKQASHTLPTADGTCKDPADDYYYASQSVISIASEGPSTAQIQTEMSDPYAR